MSMPDKTRAADRRTDGPAAGGWSWWLLDAVLVVLFAATGRASHAESSAMLAVLGTAWPFLVGLTVGWLGVATVRRRAPLQVSDGVVVWLATVVVGMLLRASTGAGTALSFVLVALGVTGLFLLGWRAIAHRRGLTDQTPLSG